MFRQLCRFIKVGRFTMVVHSREWLELFWCPWCIDFLTGAILWKGVGPEIMVGQLDLNLSV